MLCPPVRGLVTPLITTLPKAATMRMWNVSTEALCDKHLLGEHLEMHMFVGTINSGRSIDGFVSGGLVNTSLIAARHEALAEEMEYRWFNHKSPLVLFATTDRGTVDSDANLKELARRCPHCAAKQKELGYV